MNLRIICTFGALIAVGPTALAAQGYGTAVAVDGRTVFVAEALVERAEGAVFVYGENGGNWVETARLVASDATAGDHFGRGMAAAGGTLIAGATVIDSTTGAAYVFRRSGSTWNQLARLQPADLHAGDAFGRAVAMTPDVALIATWGHQDGRGAVYAYRRDGNTWLEDGKLMASDAAPNDWFGMSLAIAGDRAIIGAGRKNNNSGAAYVFRRTGNGQWTEDAILTAPGGVEGGQFGVAVAIGDGIVLAGAAGENQGTGAVYVFTPDESGEWDNTDRLVAFDAGQGTLFGASLAFDGTRAWIGAPGVSQAEGRAYIYERTANGWTGGTKVGADQPEMQEGFGGALAVGTEVAVSGLPGDDYGMGTAVVLTNRGNEWMPAAKVFSDAETLDPILGDGVDCNDGTASIFGCQDVDLVSFLPVSDIGGARGVEVNDIWGWTDPQTGREYALVGRVDGTSFVDVTDPSQPRYLGDLPKTDGVPGSTWRDIKVYRDHAFIVADGAQAHGMQVFDLTQLRNVQSPPVTFREVAHYDRIHSSHNIVINEATGFAYAVGASAGGETCGGGLHMIDIREPRNPTFAGCFADPNTGQQRTGYSHDAQCVTYHGPDADHQGKEICFGSNETALSIADVSSKDSTIALASAGYPNVGYSHQGWLSEDHRYFYMNDEGDEISGSVPGTRTLVWDVADLDDPILAREYISENQSSDHNLYIRGNLMYQSNYVSGLRVFDVSDPTNPRPVGFFDTVPWGEDAPGFDGSWSNYPFFASGTVVVTSGKEGLFLLKVRQQEIIP
jgi:choice-of-anchor B domain-containing protein